MSAFPPEPETDNLSCLGSEMGQQESSSVKGAAGPLFEARGAPEVRCYGSRLQKCIRRATPVSTGMAVGAGRTFDARYPIKVPECHE
jgi:hypothetical protein